MVKQYKIDRVAVLKEKIQKSKHLVFTNYKGLAVEELEGLKNKLRDMNVEYKVVKNTFAKRAMQESNIELDETIYKQPLGIAFLDDNADISGSAKILFQFNKDKDKLIIKGSIVDGLVTSVDDLETISKLPSKEVLIAKLIGSLKAPVSRLHNVLNGVILKLPLVLKQIEKQKAEQ